ncbi:MAG: HigA family addiction module antitoxin [Oceanibaculum sp.]
MSKESFERAGNGLPPVHPGEILAGEMEVLGLSARALGEALAVPPNRITTILKGERSVSADTALRLARFFGTSAKFWLNLQQEYDLKRVEQETGEAIRKSVRPHAA